MRQPKKCVYCDAPKISGYIGTLPVCLMCFAKKVLR